MYMKSLDSIRSLVQPDTRLSPPVYGNRRVSPAQPRIIAAA